MCVCVYVSSSSASIHSDSILFPCCCIPFLDTTFHDLALLSLSHSQ